MGKKYIKPTDKPINENGCKFGAPRHGGRTHKGIDYLAPKGTDVKASEGGLVVKSKNKPYVPGGNNNYGETIVIAHTPDVPENKRHIYTLYAHLDKRLVFAGRKVRKGETIGISGNSGMKAAYEGKKSGFHLHFEVRDSKTKMDWDRWPREHYENPLADYLCQTKTFEYEAPDEETGMDFPKGWF
ncbi:MAG: M23 family metallopeptidase [Deltaproteobacteria bacterium]|nr:M23 family metallopeptidase [Deltaproteobacteria bacterium]